MVYKINVKTFQTWKSVLPVIYQDNLPELSMNHATFMGKQGNNDKQE